MSLAASFDTKQRVKEAIDIVDLVGSYLPLRREGRGFKALCPWHDDTRPSLQVNPERQSFKCWVCNLGGDIFSFVMKMEGVEFREALTMLAERAGVPLSPPPAGRPDRPPGADDKRTLYKAMAWAVDEFHRCLLSHPEAEAARRYLHGRGLTPESIARFQLGFSPDRWEWILEQARPTAFSAAMLERVGLVSRRRQGPGYYDRFKGRVLFPIFDSQGRAIALGGRVLPELAADDVAKYLNSPETPLFTKSKNLYGLNLARDPIRKLNTVLVMEGYTDCIVAHQCGFDNAVAVLGTALAAEHIPLLHRFADRLRIILVLDGDEAGRKRSKEILALFVAANADLRVLTLPDELDPCEFLLERGAAAFEKLAGAAVDALRHAVETATAGIDLQNDLHQSAQALEQLVSTIAKAPRLRSDTTVDDRLREEKFLQRLASDFRVPEEELRARMTQLRRKSGRRESTAQTAPQAATPQAATNLSWDQIDGCERELLELLLSWPQMLSRLGDAILPEQLTFEPCRRILSKSWELIERGEVPDFERLLLEFDDPGVKNLLVEADERGRLKAASDLEVRLRDLVAGFERRRVGHEGRENRVALAEKKLAADEELAILLDTERKERTRQGISKLTDG